LKNYLINIPKISSYRLKIPVASAYSNNSVINGINLSGRIFLSSNFLRTNNNRFKRPKHLTDYLSPNR